MNRSPDWLHWSRMARLELWEAIALFSGIDPRTTSHRRLISLGLNEYTYERPSYDQERRCCEAYQTRIDIAISCIGTGLPVLNGSGAMATVELRAVTEWAIQNGWVLPKTMPVEQMLKPSPIPATSRQALPLLDNLTSPIANLDPLAVSEHKKPRNVWDEHNLGRLYIESREVGMTHKKLADRYSITTQLISKLLKKVKSDLMPRRANPFDPLGKPKK